MITWRVAFFILAASLGSAAISPAVGAEIAPHRALYTMLLAAVSPIRRGRCARHNAI